MSNATIRLVFSAVLASAFCLGALDSQAGPVNPQNAFTVGIDSVFVNDDTGLGTGTTVSCFISKGTSASPTTNPFPSCPSGLIAIPGNDSKLLNAILATKLTGNPVWLLIDTPGTTYSCGSNIGTTPCSVVTFGAK